ncbi:MAG: hypothetical protein IH899_08950 [Planctomycetes bacterium]|nr:hypothetical protein [Planctomycetota bacterium]
MRKWITLVTVVSVSFALFAAQQAFTNDTQPSAQKTTVIALAQKKAEKSSSPSKKKKTFRRRVPNYYGQIGLAKKQREKIYEIQEEYFNEISALEEKIEELKQKRDTEVYGVLSDQQKKRLDQLREAAAKKRKSRSRKKLKSKKS